MGKYGEIRRVTSKVSVAGGSLAVTINGISFGTFGELVERFPELEKMFETEKVSLVKLLAIGGQAIPVLIAAGLGDADDVDNLELGAMLDAGDQIEILRAIFSISLPNGVGPLLEALGFNKDKFSAALGAAAKAKTASTH